MTKILIIEDEEPIRRVLVRILINENDIKKINKSYFRSGVGYVSQEISTFNLSIRENIKNND